MNLKNIEGHSGYVKNTSNGAILNINKKEIVSARARKAEKNKKNKNFRI